MNKSCLSLMLWFATGVVVGSILLSIPLLAIQGGEFSVRPSVNLQDDSTTTACHSETDISLGLAALLTEEHSRRLAAEAQAKNLFEQGSQIIKAMDAEIGRLRKQLASPSRQANSPAPATPIPSAPPLGLP